MSYKIEVHNAYTLYELNEDGSEVKEPLLSFSRPQDWGNPERWTYHYCKIEVAEYTNHCHLWQEIKRYPVEACKLISSVLFMIMMPGQPKELCDRSHLEEDDFWSSEWGKRPPYYEDKSDDLEFEVTEEPELIPPGGTLYSWRVFHPDQEKALKDAQENPLPEQPFPTAVYLYTLTPDGKGHSMRSEDDQPVSGILFGTHLEENQQLSPEWINRGWQIEKQPSIERIR